MLLILFLFIVLTEGYKNITLMREYADNIPEFNMITVNPDMTVNLYKKRSIWRYDIFYRYIVNINKETPVNKKIVFIFSDWDEPFLLSNNCPLIGTDWDYHIRNHYVNVDHIDQLIAITTGAVPDCHLDIPVPYVAMSNNYLKIDENNVPSWENKMPILFWRGSLTGGDVLENNHRYKTVKFLNSFPWQDVKLSTAAPYNNLPNNESDILISNIVPLEHLCKYKYLLNINGYTHAYRLRMLTKCKSVIISMSPILDLIDYAIYPYYYRITSESEIPAIIEYLLSHDVEAKEMAERMYKEVNLKINYNTMKDYSNQVLKTFQDYEYVY
jgi:hypothetical protein